MKLFLNDGVTKEISADELQAILSSVEMNEGTVVELVDIVDDKFYFEINYYGIYE